MRELSPARNDQGESIDRLKGLYASVGGSGPRFALGVSPTPPAANFAQIIIQTSDPVVTADYLAEIRKVASERIAGARGIPRRLALGPPVATPIGVRVFGRGFEDPGFGDEWTIRRVADRVGDVLRDVEGLWDIHGAWVCGAGRRIKLNRSLSSTFNRGEMPKRSRSSCW